MGHSDIKISLTYLRRLDIPKIKESDMPMLLNCNNNLNYIYLNQIRQSQF
jgi:hypothetical protein